MRFPETKIRGTTWTEIKCLRRIRRKKADRYTREQAKVDRETGFRGTHWFRTKEVPVAEGRTRTVRITQPRSLRPKMFKRAKYPHKRFWASRTFTVLWVESYPSNVMSFFKGWLEALKFPPAPIEPGGLIPVSVDGLAPDTENSAIIEWQTQYGVPPTLH